MRKDIFDFIWKFEQGKLFLLNLLDSCALHLLSSAHMTAFLNSLESVPEDERGEEGWWLKAIPRHEILSKCGPTLTNSEQLATIICVPRAEDMDPEDEFFGNQDDSATSLTSASARIFKSRQSKKVYWLSDERSMTDVSAPDDIRDRLGLDWVGEDMVLYRVKFDPPTTPDVVIKRPSGLCRGSSRFKAHREDEQNPLVYKGWGMTVDLKRWRHRASNQATVAGAPEFVTNIGPLNASLVGGVERVGATRKPSGCTTDADHKQFAVWLNKHQALDADNVYSQLASSIFGLTP